MRKLFASLLTFALALAPASAGHMSLLGAGKVTAAGGCTEATTFLARTSGLDATHQTAYTTLICGLVTDGIFAKFDALWITATQDLATARLNLVSTSFALVNVSTTPSFTADRGFTTSSTLDVQNTQFNPSTAPSPKYTQNSAHAMVWPNQTVASNAGDMGTLNGTGFVFFFSNTTGNNWQIAANTTTTPATENTATGKGMYLYSRTASNNTNWYWNNTVSGSNASASTGISTTSVQLGGVDGNGSGNKQVSAASVGGSLTPTDAANFYSRLSAYMTAVGN